MSFSFREYADRAPDGNPIHLGCHDGLIFVFKQVQSRPRTVTLTNLDNIDGEDPDPAVYGAFEQLPESIRKELRRAGVRYRGATVRTLAGAMG